MNKISLLTALLLGAGSAHAVTLDFGNGPDTPVICSSNAQGTGALAACTNGGYINQAYGDIAGAVDVGFAQPLQAGNSLRWWSAGYNDLWGVPWADGTDILSQAHVDLRALNGRTVTLSQFDFGAYPSVPRNASITVYDLGTNQSLFHYEGNIGNGSAHTTFGNLSLSSTAGLRIEWRDTAYNVGIDNIVFEVSAVPEPSGYALLLAGLGVVGMLARRRER